MPTRENRADRSARIVYRATGRLRATVRFERGTFASQFTGAGSEYEDAKHTGSGCTTRRVTVPANAVLRRVTVMLSSEPFAWSRLWEGVRPAGRWHAKHAPSRRSASHPPKRQRQRR